MEDTEDEEEPDVAAAAASEESDDGQGSVGMWKRGPPKKAKRRRPGVTYKYLDRGRPPTSQPKHYQVARGNRKRLRPVRAGSDESLHGVYNTSKDICAPWDDGRVYRHRTRDPNRQWPRDWLYDYPWEDDQPETEPDPRFQPLSKHGDPVEKNKEYQLEKHGLYIIGQGLATSTGRRYGRRATTQATMPPKLKMSRKRSANERVQK